MQKTVVLQESQLTEPWQRHSLESSKVAFQATEEHSESWLWVGVDIIYYQCHLCGFLGSWVANKIQCSSEPRLLILPNRISTQQIEPTCWIWFKDKVNDINDICNDILDNQCATAWGPRNYSLVQWCCSLSALTEGGAMPLQCQPCCGLENHIMMQSMSLTWPHFGIMLCHITTEILWLEGPRFQTSM